MHYIHCLNNISSKGTDLLPESYELTDDASKATGILVRSAAMHDMEFPEGLLAIGRAGAGVNNIPLDRCAEEGIVVFNAPGANANAVKEMVVMALVMGCRDIQGGIAWCRENADDENIAKSVEKAKKSFAGGEIAGKTLGIVGLGAIGARVAKAACALGMSVVGFDPFVDETAAKAIEPSMEYAADVAGLYAKSDFITLHVPATDSTKNMMCADAFAQMKDGVVIVNMSRDTLVDEPDMTAALESGKVRRYLTDFATPGVMKMQHAVVFPHLGASTQEAEENCAIMATKELVAFIDRGAIEHSVNYPAIDAGDAGDGTSRIVALCAAGAADAVAALASGAAQAAKGGNAVVEADVPASEAEKTADAMRAVEGVRRVRVITL